MGHRIEITDKTYERLKEYCDLNGLKVGQLADKFIFDSLMIELYGDVPFTDYKRKPKEMTKIPVQEDIPPEIQKVINEHFTEMLDDTTPPITVNESTGEVSLNTNQILEPVDYYVPTREETEETLKQIGVPEKVVNKITKRRLK